MHRLLDGYATCALFMSVYLSEAHASDEFPLGKHVVIRQHTSLAERADAAKRFVQATGWRLPVYLDGMQNMVSTTLAAHPERFYVFEASSTGSKLLFCAPSREGGYRLEDLETFLSTYIA